VVVIVSRAFLLPFGFLALALVGCSGSDEGRPSDEPRRESEEVDPCRAADGLELFPIAEFEPTQSANGTSCAIPNCSFYFNLDIGLSPANPAKPDLANPMPLPGSDKEPVCPPGAMTDAAAPFDKPTGSVIVTPLPEARCGSSESGFHFWGKDLAVCIRPETGRPGWGAGFDVNINYTMGEQYDASEWEGVTFWVRTGSGPTGPAVNLSISDRFSSGDGSVTDPATGEMVRCDTSDPSMAPVDAPPVPDTEKCDGFGTSITLTDKWTFVRVPFATLRQKGFGMPSPFGSLQPDTLKRLQFLMSNGDWDFWIDDIAFYRTAE
jgi:hypothetical protein